MKPIMLQIRRKTKVPTKRQIKHMYRSDWKVIYVMSYEETKKLFTSLGGAPIERDAQFAKLLYDNFGEGIYSIIGYGKGRCGFWSFWYVELFPTHWRKVAKNNTKREKEINEYKQEVSRVKKQLKTENEDKERDSLNEEIDFLKEIYSIDQDIEGKKRSRGPSPYLKQTHPLYKIHAYESYAPKKHDNEVEVDDFW